MHNGNLSQRRAPALILMAGLPGSGKTTFVHALAGRLSLEHVESDAVRRSMFQQPSYSSDESARVFAAVERRAGAALRAGRDVVVDSTNLRRSDRKRFLRLVTRYDATLVCVRITAPETVIHERLSVPRVGHSQAGLAVYEAMQGRTQRFESQHLVVDTSHPIGPSVELVAAIVEAGIG